MTAKNSQYSTADTNNSVKKFPDKIIIGSQVFRKCVDLYMLKHHYIFSRGYTDFELQDGMQWTNPNMQDLQRLFFRFKELFDREGINFSLIYGSLLGAVRGGGPIKGDNDIDTIVWDENFLISKLPELQREGLMVFRIYPGKLYSFTLDKSCFIDAYIMREITGIRKLFWGKSCISLCGMETPRKFFTGWGKVDFMDVKVTCPENPERLLEFWYGPDWRIPQDKKGTYLVKSAHYYDRITSLFPRLLYLRGAKIGRFLKKIYSFLVNKEYRQKILKRKKETGSFFS